MGVILPLHRDHSRLDARLLTRRAIAEAPGRDQAHRLSFGVLDSPFSRIRAAFVFARAMMNEVYFARP